MKGSATRNGRLGGWALIAAITGASVASFAAGEAHATPAPAVSRLVGTFRLSPAGCHNGKPTGSWLSVTFGTKVIGNRDSSCDNGAYTLLQPGRKGFRTNGFSPTSELGFGSDGSPIADDVVAPVEFNGHDVTLVTSGQDLQDAPTGPRTFATPTVYSVAGKLSADLRSVQALYDGSPDSTCASGAGQGCWLLGAEHASGTYDPATHDFTLDWFTGQSFTSASAGTEVHLSGRFIGHTRPLPTGATVDLGTQSFAAGSPQSGAVTASAADSRVAHSRHSWRSQAGTRAAGHRTRTRSERLRLAAAARSRAAKSNPTAFVAGELLICLDVLVGFTFWMRRRAR